MSLLCLCVSKRNSASFLTKVDMYNVVRVINDKNDNRDFFQFIHGFYDKVIDLSDKDKNELFDLIKE